MAYGHRMPRTDPDLVADELTQFLDYHRATLVQKASGLTREQLATTVGASDLTLAGLLNHAALNEDHWFGVVLLGQSPSEPWASAPWADDPDWEFRTALDLEPDELIARYEETCERSRANVARAADGGGLDHLSAPHPRKPHDRFNLRWILLHMLEENARHNGHLDILRELHDGTTGD